VPSNYWTTPAYLSFFESHAAAQFNHRMVAYAVALVVFFELCLVFTSRVGRRVRTTAALLAAAVLGQISLGIATLLAHDPLALALCHQLGGTLVLILTVVHLHAATRRDAGVMRSLA
jgi:cytochrome c oxidase assembly protein subunit 15